MKKISIKYGMSVLLALFMAVGTLVLASCSDDDGSSGGVPEITGVRVPDPEKADSLFTQSGTGQLIVIMGKNLGGALHVYINGQEVTFNPTMNTDHSIIVTVPTEEDGFMLSAFDETIPDEIRVETRGGVATYAFKITAPYPQFSRIEADYPRDAGNVMRLYGLNLVDIERIYITDLTPEEIAAAAEAAEEAGTAGEQEIGGTHVPIDSWTVVEQDHYLDPSTQSYRTNSMLEVQVPQGAPTEGSLVIECAAGVSYVAFNYLPGLPVIAKVSNDMPQVGETFFITGSEFVQVESVSYGDVTLTEGDFRVSQSQDTIYVDFQQKPTAGSGTTLTVTTVGGTDTQENFYDHSTILTTFDGDATDNGWGPNATYEASGTADGNFAHVNMDDYGSNWWGTMVFFRKDWSGANFPLSDNIPDNAPASDIYFAYNVYDNNSDFNNGTFAGYFRYEIMDLNNGVMGQYDAYTAGSDGAFTLDPAVNADVDGNAHKGQWYRAALSLNRFSCYAGLTWADIKSTGLPQFRIMFINQATAPGHVDVKLDNVRVVYIPSN